MIHCSYKYSFLVISSNNSFNHGFSGNNSLNDVINHSFSGKNCFNSSFNDCLKHSFSGNNSFNHSFNHRLSGNIAITVLIIVLITV